ncbi:MAG: hypothetical protein J0L75_13835 [Spirochaetes bacterium]|nr:hypothetical protein [Spirochaetota bacterium]
MKFPLVCCAFLVLAALGAEVRLNEAELAGMTNAIKFRSWQGPNGKVNPEDLIIGVGERMANEMVRKGSGGWKEGYYFRRVPPEPAKMGADLFFLGPESEINHVINLSRMLQGYLKAVHGFTRLRAEAVAHFLLVYNAVKRNDRPYLQGRFAPAVDAAIPEGKLGIDTDYTNWPGKTVLVIPTLGGPGAALSAAEVGRIATERVAETPGATNLRKEFLDLRKEQVATGSSNLAAAQEALKKKDQDLEKKEMAALTRAQAAVYPVEQQRAREEQIRLGEERRELEKQQKQADRQSVAVAEERAAIRNEETRLTNILPAPATNRAAEGGPSAGEVASRMPTRATSPGDGLPNALNQGEVFFLKTLGIQDGHLLQQLLLINPNNDSMRIAPLGGISGNHFQFVEGDPILVVAGDGGKQVLARIDRKELTIKAKSTENVFHSTKIWSQEGALYAVGENAGQTYLCRFSTNLVLQARSDTVVFPDTQLAFAVGKVYCTVLQGNQNSHVIIFGASNLNRLMVLR